jgi:ABC-type transport system involved in multi-copper enzyme maturation permease subunit
MAELLRVARSEAAKTWTTRSVWITTAALLVASVVMGWIEGWNVSQIGLDATPENTPDLIAPIGPLAYLGSVLMPFGQVFAVIVGALVGSLEFRDSQLRTTLTATRRRWHVLVAKGATFGVPWLIITFVIAWATVACVHGGLGAEGLNPVALSPDTWRMVAGVAVDYTLLSVLTFSLALICRNAIVPLIVMLAQVVAVGYGLKWGEFLPGAAGNRLFELGTSGHSAAWGGTVLGLWTVAIAAGATVLFLRRDVGAR